MAMKDCGGPMGEWSQKMQTILDEMRRRKMCDFRETGAWQPTINLYAMRTGYHICVSLAGVDAHGIEVKRVAAQRICISGHRARPLAAGLNEPFSVEVMEIDEGAFHRKIDLPEPVDGESIEIRHEKGYVWILLRKQTRT